MADSRTLHTTWTMNDGGAVACLCPDGQTGKTLALHLKKINVQKAVGGGVLVPITSPSKRSQDVARPIADACLRELGDAWTLAAQLPVAKQHVPADSVEAALQAVNKVMATNPDRPIVRVCVCVPSCCLISSRPLAHPHFLSVPSFLTLTYSHTHTHTHARTHTQTRIHTPFLSRTHPLGAPRSGRQLDRGAGQG